MIEESVIRVNSKVANDFFSKSQHLNSVSRFSIWLTMGLLGDRGDGAEGAPCKRPMLDLFSKRGAILLALREALCLE